MINYTKGDATAPIGDGIKIIVHVCNNIGAWGAGFVLALSRKWDGPEDQYRRIPAKKRKLGYVQYVPVGDNMYVANMIGQENIGPNEFGVPPVRYGAIGTCLKKTAEFARTLDSGNGPASIHMPRIGCGLAGGSWDVMEKIIEEAVGDDISVTVYDFE
jgi:O-acetyl-ADP-ribose deacetylase (regulator of RNase III)